VGRKILSLQADNQHQHAYTLPVRVYYEDTDAAGVVYYASYLKFMERARTEWLRALGFEQVALARDEHCVFVVRSLTIDYLKASQIDDKLDVGCALKAVRNSSIELAQPVTRGTELIVTALVKLVCVNTLLWKPARIPQPILDKLALRQP
jgi:acyl-CoA thioester hydrolase